MIPGALLALAICLASERADWQRRASLLALLGAIGWAFGGQMSYGRIIGYTLHSSFPDVLYGYASLFVIGALWGGIGAGILAFGFTRPRSELERFAAPLAAVYLVWLLFRLSGFTDRLVARWDLYDSDWVQAGAALLVAGICAAVAPRSRAACRFIALLAGGWWAGFAVLTLALGLRMTPPRSDNWAGCVGLCVALVFHLLQTRNRAGVMLMLYGMLAGGIGFAVGDFVQTISRAQWGPIGRFASLQQLDYWKWMEQLFGLMMGLGVAFGAARLIRCRLSPPDEDETDGPLGYLSLLALFVVMPWENLYKTVRDWAKNGHLVEGLFNLAPQWWFLSVGILLTAIVVMAIVRHRQNALPLVPTSAFGRAQMLFLLILWLFIIADFVQAFPALKTKGGLFVHTTFWLTAMGCSLIALRLRSEPAPAMQRSINAPTYPDDKVWLPGRAHWLIWALIPVLIFTLSKLSVATHDAPLPNSHQRFGSTP